MLSEFDNEPHTAPGAVPLWRPRPEPTVIELIAQSLIGALSPVAQLARVLGALRSPADTLGQGSTRPASSRASPASCCLRRIRR